MSKHPHESRARLPPLPALEKKRQEMLTTGEAFGCRSQDVAGLQSGPAPAVPAVPEAPVAPAAALLPSGASSSCSRLSCRGELPRDWKSGGEALPGGPEAASGEAGVAARDAAGPRSA